MSKPLDAEYRKSDGFVDVRTAEVISELRQIVYDRNPSDIKKIKCSSLTLIQKKLAIDVLNGSIHICFSGWPEVDEGPHEHEIKKEFSRLVRRLNLQGVFIGHYAFRHFCAVKYY